MSRAHREARLIVWASLFLAVAATGCHRAALCSLTRDEIRGPDSRVCEVPGFDRRDFILHVPPSYDGSSAMPLVVALHGGGGKKENMQASTCLDGDEGSPTCLSALADREGFLVVYPDGTPAIGKSLRTWNAGGGANGYRCANGKACEEGVDDVAYFDALLDEVSAAVQVDPKRVFVTGFSNGAAMTHRLACERAARLAAVAPISGANQVAAVQGCSPTRPVPVLQIHGTADPCWGFNGGTSACLQDDGLAYVSVADTMVGSVEKPGWARRNGCSLTPAVSEIPDAAPTDGTRVFEESYPGCTAGADVVLVRIEEGGHVWPQGAESFDEETVGRRCLDFNANVRIWEFFSSHPMP